MLWSSHMHKSHQTCSPLVVHFYFLISYQKISIINEWCFQQGLIAEEKLDSYNAPYYQPYTEDLETGIENDGSFSINGLEIMVLPWDSASGGQNYDRPTTAQKIAKSMKAVQEPMLASHFGAEIMDPLFKRLMEIIAADTREVEHVSVLVSMTRKAWYHSQVSIFHDLSYCTCLSDTCLVICICTWSMDLLIIGLYPNGCLDTRNMEGGGRDQSSIWEVLLKNRFWVLMFCKTMFRKIEKEVSLPWSFPKNIYLFFISFIGWLRNYMTLTKSN